MIDIEREREERIKSIGVRHAEPDDVLPVSIDQVEPGSICRLWWMPNQSRFVVAGVVGDCVKIVHASGTVTGFRLDTLVVILDGPPPAFDSLLQRIADFQSTMVAAAWHGRPTDLLMDEQSARRAEDLKSRVDKAFRAAGIQPIDWSK